MEAGAGQVHAAEKLGSSGENSLATITVENPILEMPVQSKRDPNLTTKKMWLMHLQVEEKEEESKPSEPDVHIYKVPDLFKSNMLFDFCFNPREVHLGPYNWSKNREDMLERKRLMASRLIPSEAIRIELRGKIKSNMETLKAAFCKEVTAMDPEKWEEMFFLDGCFVLYFIFCVMYNRAADLEMKRYKIDLVHNDLFLLENQLPYKLLKILSGDDPKLHRLIYEYICAHKLGNDLGRVLDLEDEPPVHLLDCLRTIIIGRGSEPKKRRSSVLGCKNWRRRWESSPSSTTSTTKLSQESKKCAVLRHAKELTTRGIHLKPNRSGFVRDIFFHSHFIYGTLRLPRMIVDSSTRLLFLNMAAYEMCAGEASVIISYICFLDLLVNHAEDIKELQSAGILVNKLPTDEDAAKLFNEMSEGLRPDSDTYLDVKKKMQRFFENKAKASLASWVAEGYHNQFRSPLTAMAVLAAFIALCLAAIQTYFTIFH